MRALVAGWFSFQGMGATAGDLIARDLLCAWLDEVAFPYDVALALPFPGGVDWQIIDPDRYTHVVFVCGPFGNGWPVYEFLARFAKSRLIGLNLSMIESLAKWNPFDALFARDSSESSLPDMTFLAKPRLVPVVGVVLVHTQIEYQGGVHDAVHATINRVLSARDAAIVPIDTRLDVNATGLRSAAQVESLVARVDVVVTTRLHGLIFALKHGIPAVAVDPIMGGKKIRRQADTIGWRVVLAGDSLTDEDLRSALDYCLTDEARVEARRCRENALEKLRGLKANLLASLGPDAIA
jgi:hypothetical protein